MRYLKRGSSPNAEEAEAIAREYGVSLVFAKLLLARGIKDIKGFLSPGIENLHDPFLFLNMGKLCARIKKAIEAGENIAIYADYDTDGICSASIMLLALRENGAKVQVYIPDRKTEGYGTNPAAIERICSKGFSLIISVDCGIRSVSDVALAAQKGVDFIILDHHEAGELPDTPYIVDAKAKGERYPFTELCGAGIALKTVYALFGSEAMMKYIDLAGIATIGDVVSLTGENRAIAKLGIDKLRKDPNPGIAVLCGLAGIELANIGSRSVGFGIVPRLNAAGRMSHAKYALELITTKDGERRAKLASWLNELNAERQKKQTDVFKEASEQVEKEQSLLQPNVIVAHKEGWEPGIVGLGASKLAEQYNRPAIVFSETGGLLTGSARSACGVNIYEILNSAAHLYEKFGGHSQAAGLTLKKEKLAEAKKIWADEMQRHYSALNFEKCMVYDEEATAGELVYELEKELELLEPMGQDNPEPVFLMRNICLKSVSPLSGGKHYKAQLEEDFEVIRFGAEEPFIEEEIVDLIGSFNVNIFRDRKKRQLTVSGIGKKAAARRGAFAYLGALSQEFSAYIGHYSTAESEESFYDALGEALNGSPLGTLIIINSEAGEKEFLEKVNMADYRFPPEKVFKGNSADNAVMYGWQRNAELKNYDKIFLIGSYSCAELPGARLLKLSYAEYARNVFVEAVELAQMEKLIKKAAALGRGYESLREFAIDVIRSGETHDISQVWFAINVFFSLALIKIQKKEKFFVSFEGKTGIDVELLYKDDFLRKSELYRNTREIIEEGFGK